MISVLVLINVIAPIKISRFIGLETLIIQIIKASVFIRIVNKRVKTIGNVWFKAVNAINRLAQKTSCAVKETTLDVQVRSVFSVD